MSQFNENYDERYRAGYMSDFSDLAEADRMASLRKSVKRWLNGPGIRRVLDYGCGQGRFFPIWQELFPNAELYGAEISDAAIALIRENYADMRGRIFEIENSRALHAQENFFDLILSVEVMEHVENLSTYMEDIFRLLCEGGHFLWTTPCANAFSLEWLAGMVNGGIEPTSEGFRRYRWEDPAHLRRLKTRETARMLANIGYKNIHFNFRTHFFGTLTYQTWLRLGNKKKLVRFFEPIAHLDYVLFRNFPNSASMIGIAEK
jgi:SAM-dependent methyltransferase